MKLAFLFLSVATAVSQSQRDDSFSRYISRSQWNVPTAQLKSFGKECSFEWADASPLYGVRYSERWARRRNLAAAGDDAETDLFQTAEIWQSRNGAKLFTVWDIAADISDETETLACVTAQGKLQKAIVTVTQAKPEGEFEWRFVAKLEYVGERHTQSSGFTDQNGQPSIGPALGPEEQQSLNTPIKPTVLLKALLADEVQIRKDHATQE